MKIDIVKVFYALAVTLIAAGIVHQVFKNKPVAVDDFQINVDQEVDVVSCYLLLMDTRISSVYYSYLHHMLTYFAFRYYPNCPRRYQQRRLLQRPKAPEYLTQKEKKHKRKAWRILLPSIFVLRRVSLLSNILFMGMVSPPAAPQEKRGNRGNSLGETKKGITKMLQYRRKCSLCQTRLHSMLQFRRMRFLCQMRLHSILPSGLPWMSTAVMSLNFANLIQQPAQVPALTPLKYYRAFPTSGV
jgi:hypothetical protein